MLSARAVARVVLGVLALSGRVKGWLKMYSGDHFVLLCDDKEKWDWMGAEEFCDWKFGTSLASINGKNEEREIGSLYSETGFEEGSIHNRIWIGMNDRNEEGVWEWADGTEITYTNWYPGEPNDVGGEDCLELNRFSNWRWNDSPCVLKHKHFVCNQPKCAPQCSKKKCKRGSLEMGLCSADQSIVVDPYSCNDYCNTASCNDCGSHSLCVRSCNSQRSTHPRKSVNCQDACSLVDATYKCFISCPDSASDTPGTVVS